MAAVTTIVVSAAVSAAADQEDQQNDPPALITGTIIAPTHHRTPHFNRRVWDGSFPRHLNHSMAVACPRFLEYEII